MSRARSDQRAPRDTTQVIAWHLDRSTVFREYQMAYERVTAQPLLLCGLVGDPPSYTKVVNEEYETAARPGT